jgi:AraC family transcriptional regulator
MNSRLSSGHFYGSNLLSYETSQLRLTETIYPPHCRLPCHAHENSYFKFILSGAYSENLGGNTRQCRESMLTFHPSDEVHSQYFGRAETKLFRIELDPNWMAHLREFVSIKNESAVFEEGDAVCRLAARLYCEFRQLDDISPLIIEGLALEVIGEAIRGSRRSRSSQNRPPRWLKLARELIRAQATENLTLSRIAQAVGVHPVYLSRQFRRYYHSTVGDYIRQLRIEFACREIIKSNSSLADIAAACGFHDQSHFTKAFKLVLNTTPAEYRARFLLRAP